MSTATLIDRALRRARRRGPLPKGAAPSARVLWLQMTTGDRYMGAPCTMLKRVPSMAAVADGCVALARDQAARGIKTVRGRRAKDTAPVTVRTR